MTEHEKIIADNLAYAMIGGVLVVALGLILTFYLRTSYKKIRCYAEEVEFYTTSVFIGICVLGSWAMFSIAIAKLVALKGFLS